MAQKERTHRYKTLGAGSGLVRVEVLVPAEDRMKVLNMALNLRLASRIEPLIQSAIAHYGVRVTENIDIDKLSDPRERARVTARALQEHTDARGFVLARRLLQEAGN